jgi:general secretion pathway protein D
MNKSSIYTCFLFSGALLFPPLSQRSFGDDEEAEAEIIGDVDENREPDQGSDLDSFEEDFETQGAADSRVVGPYNVSLPQAPSSSPTQVSSSSPAESINVQYVEKLILNDEALPQVLAVLEQLTGKTILRDQKLPTIKINIRIQHPITQEEAILALESVLNLNGIAIVEMGENFLKAVNAKQAPSQAPKLVDQSLLDDIPSQSVYSKFFVLKYLNAPAFQKLIMPLLTPSLSSVIVFESSNGIFITDCMSNLQRVEDILQRVDRPLTVREEIFFYTARNAQVAALKERLVALQNGGLKKYLYGNVSFEADDRSNQLMILAPSENLAFIRKIIEGLDVDRDPLVRTEVFRIRHGAAKDLAEVIKKVVENQRRQEERANTYRLAQQRLSQVSRGMSSLPTADGKQTPPETSDSGDASGENQAIQFSKALSLEADERSNSILAYGTQSDIAQIRSIISKLDIVLDQVRIEVVVAQVRLNKGQVSGLETFGISRDVNDASATGNGAWVRTTAGRHDVRVNVSTPNNFLQVTGNPMKHFALSTVFQTARDDENVKIMSAPTIVTTHNREAVIEVGESRPIITSSSTDQSNPAHRRSDVTYKNIGLKLKVKPFIGSNGVIQMEIEQTVEKPQGSVTIDGNSQPVISKRQANSFVSVANQDVVVMAGLQEKEQSFDKSKLWLLGDLPLLGDTLFSSRNRTETTVELIIFIKPTIIVQPLDEEIYLEKRARTAGVYEDLKHYEEAGSFPESSPFPVTTIEPVNSFDEPPVLNSFYKQRKSTNQAENKIPSEVSSRRDADTSAKQNFSGEKKSLRRRVSVR